MQPDGPVARRGDLVALEIEELVGRHVFGQDIVAVGLEHRREDDAVKDDVVLADKVDHLRVIRLPIFLPIGRKFLGSGYITDRSIKPHVEHLSLCPLDRHGNAPIQVAAHGTGLQTAVQPALALTVDVRFPLLVTLEDPLTQESLILVEREIPVPGFTLDGHRTRDGAVRLDQFVGRERRSALLALVAIGTVIPALRARTDNIAVGQERFGLLVVILHRGLLDKLAVVVELAEEIRCGLGVDGRRGARIDVERHAQTLERPFDQLVVAIDDLLGRNALLAGLDGDGHTVFIGAADRNDVAPLQTKVARIDIRRYVNSRQVTDMDRTVGIGERRCNEITFELFGHKQVEYC